MRTLLRTTIGVAAVLVLFACSGEGNEIASGEKDGDNKYDDVWTFPSPRKEVDLPKAMDTSLLLSSDALAHIDLNQDLSGRSLQELRLLRNAVYASYGFCFMKADIRGYFSANTTWYDKLMEERYFASENDTDVKPIILTAEESKFISRVELMEKELLKNNFYDNNGYRLANISNIVNLFQFSETPKDFMSMLDRQNFAMVSSDQIQLFHLYEQNDYNQVPNYVTTDLFLQLYHMYFSYLLKSLEMGKFSESLTDISISMYNESVKICNTSVDPEIRRSAEFNMVFYAVPYTLLTGKKLTLQGEMGKHYLTELKNIEAATDAGSLFLKTEADFPYSLFKPRGHYTRKEELKKYFKAMMWLQYAWHCMQKEEQLRNATLAAFLLANKKSNKGKDMTALYNSVYEPILFIIGEPDNLSVMDIVEFMKTNKISEISHLSEKTFNPKIIAHLTTIYKDRNKIKPKDPINCAERINFMPQRYLVDNEILQEMVDVKPDAERHMPRGLDVLASFGVKQAEDILRNFHHDQDRWGDFNSRLEILKKKFSAFTQGDKSVYNKWIQSLVEMQKRNKDHPSYMQTPYWERKNLNTALASWAELKHDAILYGEQPMAAECGGAGPPPPVTVGYVEPNVNFWKKMNELCKLTAGVLQKNDLLSEDLKAKGEQISNHAAFLLSASEKELKGQKLSDQEYNTIEVIGSSVEWLTLSILEPGLYLDSWSLVQGPDKSISVVADIYTRNVAGCSKNGILHVAVGKVNEIYVVVEIEGYLYLTKGATFGYYEFQQEQGKRLTDEEWQEMLEGDKLPDIPGWMKEILISPDERPTVDEKLFYSSGC